MGERLTISAFRFLLGIPETGKDFHFPLDFRPEKNRKTTGILIHFPAFRLPLGIPETGKLWPHLEKTLRASKEKDRKGFTISPSPPLPSFKRCFP